MGYYINLASISIDSFKNKLEAAYLPPSRMMLKENTKERFNYFKSIGIGNVDELLQLLKKKDKLTELSKVSCFSENYLKILLRELNSIQPKPVMINEFPGVSSGTIEKLEKAGIKNTVKLFENVITDTSRKELAGTTGVDQEEIIILTKLSDLSRIKWVGATFARMLFDLGYDSAEKVSKANSEELHKKINQFNKEKNIFKGQIGLNDIKIVVGTAKELPKDIVL